MKTKIELTEQEQSIIESALTAYWHDAETQLQNQGRYTPVGKIPLSNIEKKLLELRKKLTFPIISRFENLD